MSTHEASFNLAAFVRELALAWQRLSMYQEGHPARRQVTERLIPILAALVAPTGSIALGVGRDAIIGAEEKIRTTTAARLAEALYHRSVAVVRFEEGVGQEELERFLSLIPRGRVSEEVEPLWDVVEAQGISHIKLEPIDFSSVVATEGLAEAEARSEQESLWDDLLQRLLNDDRLGLGDAALDVGDDSVADVLALVRRVMERRGIAEDGSVDADAEARDKAIDALAALGGLLGGATGGKIADAQSAASRSAAARHLTELLGAIPEGLRESVLDAALTQVVGKESTEGFADIAGSMSAAQIVASLRRLRSERVAFSPRLLGLLDDLVLQAAPAISETAGEKSPDELAGELQRVFGDDDVDRISPRQQRIDRLVLALRRAPPQPAAPEELEPRIASLAEHQKLLRLAQTLLDLLQRPFFSEEQIGWVGARVERVMQALLASGRFTNAVRVVRSLKALAADAERSPKVRQAADNCLARLEQPETIAALVEALGGLPEESIPLVHQLIELLGDRMITELLLALCEEADLARRRHTFDMLVSLGSTVSPHAAALLGDERWYVNRNMLSMIRQVGDRIPLAMLRGSLEHPDARVRLEATKCLGAVEDGIPASLLQRLLGDDDAKIAETTATMIGRHRLEQGYEPLIEAVKQADPLTRRTAVRCKALLALGELGRPEALSEIGHFFRSWFAVVTPDERRAAFASLAGYPAEARRPLVEKGLKSSDDDIRKACEKIARGPA